MRISAACSAASAGWDSSRRSACLSAVSNEPTGSELLFTEMDRPAAGLSTEAKLPGTGRARMCIRRATLASSCSPSWSWPDPSGLTRSTPVSFWSLRKPRHRESFGLKLDIRQVQRPSPSPRDLVPIRSRLVVAVEYTPGGGLAKSRSREPLDAGRFLGEAAGGLPPRRHTPLYFRPADGIECTRWCMTTRIGRPDPYPIRSAFQPTGAARPSSTTAMTSRTG